MLHSWAIDRSSIHMPTGETVCPPGCALISDSDIHSPTALDVVFAAHTHILMNVPFMDPLLQALLSESYPTLIAHAKAVQSAAFPDPQSFPPAVPLDLSVSLKLLLPTPTLRFWASRRQKKELTEEERRFRRARWGWIGLALASVACYAVFLRPTIVFVDRDDLDAEEVESEGENGHDDGGGASEEDEDEDE